MMQQCQSCYEPGASRCAAIWTYDALIVACLRLSEGLARQAGRTEILISDFVLALCRHDHGVEKLKQFGVDAAALHQDLLHLAHQPSGGVARGRVALSAPLNALLLASEDGAAFVGADEVSMDNLCATLAHNAGQDPAAHIFARHATALRRDRADREVAGRGLGAGAHDDQRPLPRRPIVGMHPNNDAQAGAERRRAQSHPTTAGRQQETRHSAGHSERTSERHESGASIRTGWSFGQHGATQKQNKSSQTSSSGRASDGYSRSRRASGNGESEAGARSEFYDDVLRLLRAQEQRLERLEAGALRAPRKRLNVKRIGLSDWTKRKKRRSEKQSSKQKDKSGTAAPYGSGYEQRDGARKGLASLPPSASYSSSEASSSSRSTQATHSTSSSSGGASRHGNNGRSATQSRQSHSQSSRASTTSTHSRDNDFDQNRNKYAPWGTRDRDRTPFEYRDRNRDDGPDRERQDRERYSHRSSQRSSRSERGPREDRSSRGDRPTREDRPARQREDRAPRFYLSLDDDLVDAPSIGPKTAARFTPLGILTVRDFLMCDVEETANRINVRHITAEILRDWQDQARLVCTIPFLRGTHAQLLVGAEYRQAKEIAESDLGEVLAGVLRFAATKQGERVLRSNAPPEREKVATWVDHAKQADMSRVA